MGRIPEDELERIKRDADLVRLVRSRGIELTQHGHDLLGLCPFHEDHEPSLIVTPGKNLWHCLGACSTGGSAIDWVMKAEGVSFRHAVEILRAGGPPPSFGAAPVSRSTSPKLAPPVELSAADHELLLQVLEYYHQTLLTSPEALEYLATRGIGSPEAIRAFRLGFANRTLGLRLPAKNREDGLKIRSRLASLGLIRDSGHEHFNGCLVVPVFDAEGRAVEVYGRKIVHHQARGLPSHLYLPGPHRGVFNLAALRSSKEVILCEALIDALTFWCAGFPNVTAAYGVNGFTSDHLEAFKAYGTERVLIAYDRDEAGDRAAEELGRRLGQEGITSFRVRFPHGMDANDYACKVTPASQSLAVLLRSAEYLAGPIAGRPGIPSAETRDDQLLSLAAASEVAFSEPVSVDPVRPASPAVEPPAPSPTQHTDSPTPAEPAVASPVPAPPRPDIPAEVSETEVVLRFDGRRWRVRGLGKNLSFETLRVNVLVGLDAHPERFHQDTLDLYSAKQRQAFVRQATTELGVKEDLVKKDLGQVLLKLEALQEQQIKAALEPKEKAVVIDEKDRAAALELLRDPKLLDRILADFHRCGVVGEETNTLIGYLAAVSRKLDEPLAVIIQSSSAAGKSALMDAVLAFVPPEERVQYSAMTGQSLFYMGEADLKHKILAIAEEEGAERASYALKLLQSEGELTIASTGKDPTTGRLVTHEYRVEGPVMIVLTTTAIDIDEELLNRCLVLSVNEDREQTRAIHRLQRERQTLEGLLAKHDRDAVLQVHRTAQRLIRPLLVANPYARHLTFLDDKTRMRRDHVKYLTLIRTIALLHQHQRPIRSVQHDGQALQVLEVTLDDIETANRLAHEVLGRTLDELPPQTRRFLLLLDEMVRSRCKELQVSRQDLHFSRAEARAFTSWSYPQVRAHLDRLVELEYVLVHRGTRGQTFVYELLWDGKGHDGSPFLMGLLDVEALRKTTAGESTTATLTPSDEALRGPEGGFAGPLTPHCGVIDPPLRSRGNGRKPKPDAASDGQALLWPENAHLDRPESPRSYLNAGRSEGKPLSLAAPAAEGSRS
jgi:DNA primase